MRRARMALQSTCLLVPLLIMGLASDARAAKAPTAATERLSLQATPGGLTQAGAPSDQPSVSADGRYVAFTSESSLVAADVNIFRDVYVHDRARDQIILVSRRQNPCWYDVGGGEQYPCVSGDAHGPVISHDGSTVAFTTTAGDVDLVWGPEGPGVEGQPREDTKLTSVQRVVVASLGSGRLTLGSASAEGSLIVCLDQHGASQGAFDPDLSRSGHRLVFTTPCGAQVADNDVHEDVYVRDTRIGVNNLKLVSRERTCDAEPCPVRGPSNEGSLSGDGRFVAFTSSSDAPAFRATARGAPASDSNDVRDVFVRDLSSSAVTLESYTPSGATGDGFSVSPSLDAGGGRVAFASTSSNLSDPPVASRGDVLLRRRSSGGLTRLSVGLGGEPADGVSGQPDVSLDGRIVAFASLASNLVPGDSNHSCYTDRFGIVTCFGLDVFVYDTKLATTARVSVGLAGQAGPNGQTSWQPSTSGDGRYVAYSSNATNLVESDTNGHFDVFVRYALLGASPSALSFETPLGGKSAVEKIVVRNSGEGPVQVGAVGLSGPDPRDFRIVSNSCGTKKLYPGGRCRLEVRFVPQQLGTRRAVLTIDDPRNESSTSPPSPPRVQLEGMATP